MKKRLAIILSLVMAASMVGCGSTASSSGGESKSDTAETQEPEKSSSGSATEVELWHYFDQADQPMLEELVKQYNEMQDDINITVTYVAREELMNQYTIGAVSGELPDIGMVDSPDMASYISLGVFDDCTTELTDWGELDKFYDGPLASCTDADGKFTDFLRIQIVWHWPAIWIC